MTKINFTYVSNGVKVTYSNVEFRKFSWGCDTPGPHFKRKGQNMEGRGVREGKLRRRGKRKENVNLPPTSFGLKVALVIVVTILDCVSL